MTWLLDVDSAAATDSRLWLAYRVAWAGSLHDLGDGHLGLKCNDQAHAERIRDSIHDDGVPDGAMQVLEVET